MNRRFVLKAGVAAAGTVLLSGHTPYRQWVVYRKKHLLIGSHRATPRTYELAKRIVAVLDDHLPEARARVARAPTAGRIASLIGTGQLETAILTEAEAADMAAGRGAFEPYGAIDLRRLASLDGHAFVAAADFADHHAWLVIDALFDDPMTDRDDPIHSLPWHPGAEARFEDRPMPTPPADAGEQASE